MQFISTKTTIPIPRIRKVYTSTDDPDLVDIVFESISGDTLAVEWFDMNSEQRRRVVTELAGYIDEMRSLEPPQKGLVGNTTLGPAYDHRLGTRPRGPFQTIADFHTFVRHKAPYDHFDDP